MKAQENVANDASEIIWKSEGDNTTKEILAVRPSVAHAVLCYSEHPNGEEDESSLHGECPVLLGEKWAAKYVGKLNTVDADSRYYNKRITQKIMRDENLVTDTSIPRTYSVCNGTYIDVKSYNYLTDKFTGDGLPELSTWNPSVNPVCADSGEKGELYNDCTLTGDTVQIKICVAKNDSCLLYTSPSPRDRG